MAVRRTEATVIIHVISTGKCKAAISTAKSRIDSVNATINENIIKVQHGVSFWELSASRIAGILCDTVPQNSIAFVWVEESQKAETLTAEELWATLKFLA